jgi:hypothetical protein
LGSRWPGSGGCSRLIANAVIYYNVMVLSRGMNRKSHPVTKRPPTFVKAISPNPWHHHVDQFTREHDDGLEV